MRNFILFGFQGSGKTHLGKLLAAKLNRPFLDTDALVAEQTGMTSRECFRLWGEARFRELESKIIFSLPISGHVIALGGGAVLNPANVSHLQSIGELIYLDASFKTIEKRISANPLFVKESLRVTYEERRKIYEAIPAHRFLVDQENIWPLISSDKFFASLLSVNHTDPPSAS